MRHAPDYTVLTEALVRPDELLHDWMVAFSASNLRLPGAFELDSMAASVEPIAHALATVVALDRVGEAPRNLRFLPGSSAVRELEKAVSFAAANLGAFGFTAFDVGGLFFALRDVLCGQLGDPARGEMQSYMEWLAILATDSLATGREQALVERMHNDLDEGTPLVMITHELPAVLFVGRPDSGVVASVFGRLLLMVVRTGARAVIIDVRGMPGGLHERLSEPLERFLSHPRVSAQVQVYACGVRGDDVGDWQKTAARTETSLVIEDHFDECVLGALKLAGWRLLPAP